MKHPFRLDQAHGSACGGLLSDRRDRCLFQQAYNRQFGSVDPCHGTVYNVDVIKTFKDRAAMDLYNTGESKRLQPDIIKRAIRRLEYVDLATCLDDLKVPPSNRLDALKGDLEGQYSISINDQWRICFRFSDGDAYDVEITDYH
jgi:toxin HigB-1